MILHDDHNCKIARHFRTYKTPEGLKHYYHSHKMEEDVKGYVWTCDTCQRDEGSRHRRYRKLEPLDVPYRPWPSILMNWIIELLEWNRYTQIWVIVNRLTKMAHLVPLPTNTSAKDLAKIFLKEVWKNHGLPTDIVSDWDTRVTSHFWQAVIDLLGIQTKLSTAFHLSIPKTLVLLETRWLRWTSPNRGVGTQLCQFWNHMHIPIWI